jgi:hypothetical protein
VTAEVTAVATEAGTGVIAVIEEMTGVFRCVSHQYTGNSSCIP